MTKLALSKAPIAMPDDFDSDPGIIMLVDEGQDEGRRPGVTISPDFIVTIHNEGQSNDPHYNDLLRLARRMRVSLKNIRYQLTHLKTPLTAEEEYFYRMRFFNIRAIGLMLEHSIPQWTNCRDDEAIVQQCAKHGIIPTLDEWQADWLTFAIYCADTQYQRENSKKVQQNKANKLAHIVGLKAMKAKALLAAVEFGPSMSIDFGNHVSFTKKQNGKVKCDGSYVITLRIDHTEVKFHICYYQLEASIPILINGLRCISELVDELHKALATDAQTHSPLHLYVRHYQLYPSSFGFLNLKPIYRLIDANRREVEPTAPLASSKAIGHLNAALNNLYKSLAKAKRTAQ